MLLTIDIGNSNIKLGLFNNVLIKKLVVPIEKIFLFKEELADIVHECGINDAVICSVVPCITEEAVSILKSLGVKIAFVISKAADTGIEILSSCAKKTVGADRGVNMIAAFEYYKSACAVVDFGSCTTISVVNESGAFQGGAIMPGIYMMVKCLAEKTARLPIADLDGDFNIPSDDTNGAINCGILYGSAGAVERILYEIEQNNGSNLNIIVTGGNALLMERFFRKAHILDADLTLKGLTILYGRQTSVLNS
ncbi:Bordetella pertussis Bvg accessory factor [Candidatus Magnetoovum chiemensis]|nr:Bordetella pertussis Bvg accessory factor [Candidatus Magnetoovum chiemensis]